MRKNLALAFIAALVLVVGTACFDLPGSGGDTTIVNTATNNNGPTAVPTPGASPSPSAGSCPGAAIIASIRVNPFGYECAAGIPEPNNNSGLLPVGCEARLTATPKRADGTDVPADLHGTEIVWGSPIGTQYIQTRPDSENTFNRYVRAVTGPGQISVPATVCGKTGAWEAQVTVP
jgi:hypothetical protein